jgi:3-phenylpropionate/trans-cinnamate dioxygenase ferredoxin subunit
MTESPHWIHIGRAAELPPGAMKDFKVDETHSVLVANCDGCLYAIEDRCTHDDGPLAEGTLLGCQVECPRHGARFDMETGRALTLPAIRPVASYPVRLTDGGEIEVDLSVPTPTPPRPQRRPGLRR